MEKGKGREREGGGMDGRRKGRVKKCKGEKGKGGEREGGKGKEGEREGGVR